MAVETDGVLTGYRMGTRGVPKGVLTQYRHGALGGHGQDGNTTAYTANAFARTVATYAVSADDTLTFSAVRRPV
jgi:hypothetical protein